MHTSMQWLHLPFPIFTAELLLDYDQEVSGIQSINLDVEMEEPFQNMQMDVLLSPVLGGNTYYILYFVFYSFLYHEFMPALPLGGEWKILGVYLYTVSEFIKFLSAVFCLAYPPCWELACKWTATSVQWLHMYGYILLHFPCISKFIPAQQEVSVKHFWAHLQQ